MVQHSNERLREEILRWRSYGYSTQEILETLAMDTVANPIRETSTIEQRNELIRLVEAGEL